MFLWMQTIIVLKDLQGHKVLKKIIWKSSSWPFDRKAELIYGNTLAQNIALFTNTLILHIAQFGATKNRHDMGLRVGLK